MKENPKNESFEFYPVEGTGVVATCNGYVDVPVYGYFIMWDRWSFIIHDAVEHPECITVSEASTGRRLNDDYYDTVDEALYYILPFIRQKKYYLATSVGNALVRQRNSLLCCNTGGLRTLAINIALWNM